ncbi:uncharacterized protein LOC121654016 [Melanotaenia boesemani]|uniref:uncharacterized protein LOC121654016 n=1 Tax=Melanotaenia boesemani TaxID=1250792 RepID=UPI001C03C4C8|nr:uncharacterized protein LOC121654016 [Melanotaenia boesemani]
MSDLQPFYPMWIKVQNLVNLGTPVENRDAVKKKFQKYTQKWQEDNLLPQNYDMVQWPIVSKLMFSIYKKIDTESKDKKQELEKAKIFSKSKIKKQFKELQNDASLCHLAVLSVEQLWRQDQLDGKGRKEGRKEESDLEKSESQTEKIKLEKGHTEPEKGKKEKKKGVKGLYPLLHDSQTMILSSPLPPYQPIIQAPVMDLEGQVQVKGQLKFEEVKGPEEAGPSELRDWQMRQLEDFLGDHCRHGGLDREGQREHNTGKASTRNSLRTESSRGGNQQGVPKETEEEMNTDLLEAYLDDSRREWQQSRERGNSRSGSRAGSVLGKEGGQEGKDQVDDDQTEGQTPQKNRHRHDHTHQHRHEHHWVGDSSPVSSHTRSRLKEKLGPEYQLQCPLVDVGGGRTTYRPWKMVDKELILGKLPKLSDGASAWIRMFENLTVSIPLAMGDFRSLLAGSATTSDLMHVEVRAGSATAPDEEDFDLHRHMLYAAMRERWQTSSFEALVFTLKDGETPEEFILRSKTIWTDHTGMNPSGNNQGNFTLFKQAIISGLPQEVQTKLSDTPGLNSKQWAEWLDHVQHHLRTYLKKQQEDKESQKDMELRLLKMQLREAERKCTDSKKSTPKQTPVMPDLPAPQQSPITQTPPMIMVQMPQPQQQSYQNWGPPRQLYFRGHGQFGPRRGRGGFRGRRGRNYGGSQWSGDNQCCYNCGQSGHWARDCPNSPVQAQVGGQGPQFHPAPNPSQAPGQMWQAPGGQWSA